MVGLGRRDLSEDWGNCLGGGTEKKGSNTKILRREASWVKGWCLKMGAGTPLRTMRWFLLFEKLYNGERSLQANKTSKNIRI